MDCPAGGAKVTTKRKMYFNFKNLNRCYFTSSRRRSQLFQHLLLARGTEAVEKYCSGFCDGPINKNVRLFLRGASKVTVTDSALKL